MALILTTRAHHERRDPRPVFGDRAIPIPQTVSVLDVSESADPEISCPPIRSELTAYQEHPLTVVNRYRPCRHRPYQG